MSQLDPSFLHTQYLLRRKVFAFLGAKFHIYDMQGNLVFFSKQKAFKLKEDIRLYADEAMTRELMAIKARKVLDFASTYDVTDATTGEMVGSLRRKGLESIVRDKWLIFDAQGREIGYHQEDSMGLALVRRFVPLGNLIPQGYHVYVGGKPVAFVKQNFNPFVLKYVFDLAQNDGSLDPRLAIAAGILLCAVEGRQR